MTEMAPEQPLPELPEEGEAYTITSGGSLTDGRFTIVGELGGVTLKLKFDKSDEDAYGLADILIQAFPEVVTRVCNAIVEQAGANV